jgi:hypothetical protein
MADRCRTTHVFDTSYSISPKSAPRLLKEDDNLSLTTAVYRSATGEAVTALDRLNFIFTRILQAYDNQEKTIPQYENLGWDILDYERSAGLKSFLSILPDPCRIHDCSQCKLPDFTC